MSRLTDLSRRRPALLVLAVVLTIAGLTGAGLALGRLDGGQQAGAGQERPHAEEPDESPTLPTGPLTTTGTPAPSTGASASSSAPGDQAPGSTAAACPSATTSVSSAEQLTAALNQAAAGDVIELRAGVYEGQFVAGAAGTPQAPIFLCGGRDAVLDGESTAKGYVLHLDHAKYWRLVGFTVRNGQKGVMADGTVGSVIQGLAVSQIGDEAIHLRAASTDNVVKDNTVSQTGLRRTKFGEGIYVGTARSNWCDISSCQPDRSDRNVIRGNTISGTTSENVDVKEGTTGGVLVDNHLDGAATTAADSLVDVKGNRWLIEGNRGENSPQDGFQTHQIVDGWGDLNVFRKNTTNANGPGYGVALRPVLRNVVTCDNAAPGAGEGLTNTTCR